MVFTRTCIVAAGVVSCLGALAIPPAPAAAADLPFSTLSFGNGSAVSTLTPRNATLTPIDGGVRIAFTKVDWPSVWFSSGKTYASKDWTATGGLLFDITNPEKEPVTINVRIDDSEKADGQAHIRNGSLTLAPGERASVVFPFETTAPGMRGGPPLPAPAGARTMTVGGQKLDYANIVAFQIFLGRPAQPREIVLHSVKALPKPDLQGMVDRFGQYARGEWPGKVSRDDELKARIAEEESWIAAHPAPKDRDEYGGWAAGPQLKATGFFRTALIEKGREVAAQAGKPLTPGQRWWLVTPGGRLFWSVGVDCVRPYSEGPILNRTSMFSWLPPNTSPTGSVDFYRINLERKYGAEWQSAWSASMARRLPSWGFNTIGNWSDMNLVRGRKVPYTRPLSIGGLPYISADPYEHAPGPHRRLFDYFDEKFPVRADEIIAKGTEEIRNDPWCVGYFVDNELAWDSWAQMGRGGEYVVAQEAIGAAPTLAARRAFVDILRKKYGTPEAWGKAWGVTVTSWDAPVRVTKEQKNDAYRADASAFLTALAERYFTVVQAAMKRHAPNQLYLGPRFAIRPKEVVDVSARYCDVVSFNIYDYTVKPETWRFTEELGKPILIGEFHFGATDRGMFHTGLRATPDQDARAKAYADYVRSVLALPSFVGCHWFQFADQPLTGRFDGENYNIGFVTITDTPYPELRASAREINSRVYEIAGATP